MTSRDPGRGRPPEDSPRCPYHAVHRAEAQEGIYHGSRPAPPRAACHDAFGPLVAPPEHKVERRGGQCLRGSKPRARPREIKGKTVHLQPWPQSKLKNVLGGGTLIYELRALDLGWGGSGWGPNLRL